MKIGLEVHVALPTKTKLFCSCKNEDREEPNVNICPVCIGFPGSKPVLNKEAVIIARNIANALGCKLNNNISFVRKVYFYPDLPKDYQITQLESAIGYNGKVMLWNLNKEIGIRRVQLEEDAAKIVHIGDGTLIDFNRSGIPLVEIVTEPDIISLEELREFMHELRSILYYQGIDIEREIKVDLNISIAGDRIEVKNILGIKNLIESAQYEKKRQERLIAQGKIPERETRFYDENEKVTKAAREKESEEEYGFIYESDLTNYDVSALPLNQPIIPGKVAREIASKYNYSELTIRELIYFDKLAYELLINGLNKHPISNIINAIEAVKKYKLSLSIEDFDKIAAASDKVSLTKETIDKLIKGENVESVNVAEIVEKFLTENKELVEKSKTDKRLINFIIGEISKKYKVNPKDIIKILKDKGLI
jgi:aspartyl-tRNA(Asn)/glutamyl-tRNA(Gln) amidotransferase subunit B